MSALPFSPSNLFDEGTSGDDWPSDNILSTRSLIGPAISDNDFVEWLQESQLQGTGPETEEDSRLQSVLKVSQKPNILSSFSPKKAKPQVRLTHRLI